MRQAGLKDAVEVPIFVVEEKNDIESLLQKSSAFGMGGWCAAAPPSCLPLSLRAALGEVLPCGVSTVWWRLRLQPWQAEL